MRRRLDQPPTDRWQRWATATSPGFLSSDEWQAVAHRLDVLHEGGVDTTSLSGLLRGAPTNVALATLTHVTPGTTSAIDWRPWARAIQSDLLLSPSWQEVSRYLTQLQTSGADFDSFADTLTGLTPDQIASGLRRILMQHLQPLNQEAPRSRTRTRTVDRRGPSV